MTEDQHYVIDPLGEAPGFYTGEEHANRLLATGFVRADPPGSLFVQTVMVSPEDAWVLLMSTVRYSMGRRTYMSVLAPELVMKYSASLTTEQMFQMADEVLAELSSVERVGKTLGSESDHVQWRQFAADLLRLARISPRRIP